MVPARALARHAKQILNQVSVDAEPGSFVGDCYVDYDDDFTTVVASYYAGSILWLTPSGKVYTPWANSNVTDKEAERDEQWWNSLEQELGKHCWLQSGEGDLCDVYVLRYLRDAEQRQEETACTPSLQPNSLT